MSCERHCGPTTETRTGLENPPPKASIDWLLWSSLTTVLLSNLIFCLQPALSAQGIFLPPQGIAFTHATFEYTNQIWPGLLMGFLMVSLLSHIPQEMVLSLLGKGDRVSGILRATLAGFLLDLCSHGVLMVAAKLYQRGVSLGQVMAFLITSPWNSFSLTLILVTLIGWKWMLIFLGLSMLIGTFSGILFNQLVKWQILPPNPAQAQVSENYKLWPEVKTYLRAVSWNIKQLPQFLWVGIQESAMVVKWVFLSIILVGLMRVFLNADTFQFLFGPTLQGLGITLLVASVVEVCSEGSVPIAADIFTRAHAPGNSLAFLMAGASTDYTEIMVLKSTTQSWKIALFLPLITVPQILLVAWLLNFTSRGL